MVSDVQFFSINQVLFYFPQHLFSGSSRRGGVTNCTHSLGARFIHAAVNLTVFDILSPVDVSIITQSFFDHDRAINHDGHTRPLLSLLSVKVTDLADGVFVGCSFNVVNNGESFWMFFNTLSEIFKAQDGSDFPILWPLIHNRWILDGHGPLFHLTFIDEDQFLNRHEAPPFQEMIFHFSSQSITQLKVKGNQENNTNAPKGTAGWQRRGL